MADHESTILKLRAAAAGIIDRFHEWRFGIQSGGNDPRANTMDASCNGYRPTGYRAFRKLMRHVAIHPDRDVFLDFEAVLERVFEKLRQSIAEAPRLVSVLYVSPPGTPHLANLQQRLAWLTE